MMFLGWRHLISKCVVFSSRSSDERAKEMEKLEEQVSELEQRLAEVNIEKASLDESKEVSSKCTVIFKRLKVVHDCSLVE